MIERKSSLDEGVAATGSKRILALDGDEMRCLLSLGYLERMESLLRERHGNDPAFRLCHYFDLIAATSTGALIAALLAQGKSMEEVSTACLELASRARVPSWWDPRGWLGGGGRRSKEQAAVLCRLLGADSRLGECDHLRTGLLVLGQGAEQDGPWWISNRVQRRDARLWQVVQSAIEAPNPFPPALHAYGLATGRVVGLNWAMGRDRLLIHAIGVGSMPAARQRGWGTPWRREAAMDDLLVAGARLVDSLMGGLAHSLTPPCPQDPPPGDLSPRALVAEPCFSYARHAIRLAPEELGLSGCQLATIQARNQPKRNQQLLRLGRMAAQGQVRADHFPPAFDLAQRKPGPPPPLEADPRAYRQRQGREVTAIRLNLDLEAFTYRKWGSTQNAKPGDWLVDHDGSVHTVDGDCFARTYRPTGPGRYRKQAMVWAAPASRDGVIFTLEGATHYRKGDYLVWNDEERSDGYAIGQDLFPTLYEPVTAEELESG